jgi:anaerobic selenocysteine-containing dehydrogenase
MGNGIELHHDGVQAARALACLQSICGNLDVPGGGLLTMKNGLAPLVPPVAPFRGAAPVAAIGAREFPCFHELRGQAQANLLARAILDGDPYPVAGMVVGGSNPLLQWPGVGRLREALARLELLVVMDTSFTETTRMADFVLPATLPVERDEVWDTILVGGEPRLGLSPAAVERPEARDDWEFWAGLARRLGHGESFPWASAREALDWRLAPLGVDTATLAARGPEGLLYAERTTRSYERGGFKTPSGKVELASSILASRGYDPVPGRDPQEDGPAFPLVLTSGARTIGYTHSRYRQVPALRRLQPKPLLDVHPETARAAGLAEGDLGLLTSAHDSLRVEVRFAADLAPRVLRMQHGWEEANVNRLSSAHLDDLDPISGFPCFRSLPVRLEAASEASAAESAQTTSAPLAGV